MEEIVDILSVCRFYRVSIRVYVELSFLRSFDGIFVIEISR